MILFRFAKIPVFALSLFGLACSLGAAGSTVFSTNAGKIPGTEIAYTVTLEENVTSTIAIRFKLTNNSAKEYYLHRSAFDVPGSMAVFFSTDDTPIISSTAEWASDSLPSGAVMGVLPLRPGKSIEEVVPVGFYYDKIYKKRRLSDIYVYWGVTIPSNSDDAEEAQLEGREVRPITQETLPRIGGMLTLPRKERD